MELSTKTVCLLFTAGFYLATSPLAFQAAQENKLCATAQLTVNTVTACQAAATFLDLTFKKSFRSSSWPKGCFAYSSCLSSGCSPKSVYFNTHITGNTTGNPTYAVQICSPGKI